MITVYSKNNCPECVKAFDLLDRAEVAYTIIKVDENPDARAYLVNAGHRAVPQVYFNGQCLGSYAALNNLGVEGVKSLFEALK